MFSKVRSKAPLRLGFAGGGTDVSPYSDKYGGHVLNATISMYAYCTIEQRTDNQVVFAASDIHDYWQGDAAQSLAVEGRLVLHKAIYNRMVKDYNGGNTLPITVTTFSDAPPGSGLGSSSTMTVAIIAAYAELLKVPLGEYDMAHLAYEIERIECGLNGGKQDQYAATFGGFNFMEFYGDDHVIVNPLRMKNETINELESHLFLYYTGKSRDSAKIIEEQTETAKNKGNGALEAMHDVKASATKIKESILRFDMKEICKIFNDSWVSKKKTSESISNSLIEDIYGASMDNGALAGKISGAGGGGFMMILVKPERKLDVIRALNAFDGRHYPVSFDNNGVQSWVVQ